MGVIVILLSQAASHSRCSQTMGRSPRATCPSSPLLLQCAHRRKLAGMPSSCSAEQGRKVSPASPVSPFLLPLKGLLPGDDPRVIVGPLVSPMVSPCPLSLKSWGFSSVADCVGDEGDELRSYSVKRLSVTVRFPPTTKATPMPARRSSGAQRRSERPSWLALTGHSLDRVWLSSAIWLSDLRRSAGLPAQ